METKTKVGIIGAGPAGLTLALLLQRAGIDCLVLESRTREYVESRVRAGLLEQNTVDLFKELGAGARMMEEGLTHHGVYLSFEGERIRVPFDELTGGRCITIYGQQEVLKDLLALSLERGIPVSFETKVTLIRGIHTPKPSIQYQHNGTENILECDFIAGCDGFHGMSKKALPKEAYKEYQIDYPFSWLGILANVAPSTEELIYAYHQKGFALHSLRSEKVSRLYLQIDNNDKLDNWNDEKIWDELSVRLGTKGWSLKRGPIFEKAITPMRSFMIDHLQYGKLFLAGDAAHIVPPTGGKGLNLAVADIRWLSSALIEWYQNKKDHLLKEYSSNALRRVWRAQDFSNFMTYLFHKQAPYGSFEYQLQKAKFDYIRTSRAYATTIAENYVGLKDI